MAFSKNTRQSAQDHHNTIDLNIFAMAVSGSGRTEAGRSRSTSEVDYNKYKISSHKTLTPELEMPESDEESSDESGFAADNEDSDQEETSSQESATPKMEMEKQERDSESSDESSFFADDEDSDEDGEIMMIQRKISNIFLGLNSIADDEFSMVMSGTRRKKRVAAKKVKLNPIDPNEFSMVMSGTLRKRPVVKKADFSNYKIPKLSNRRNAPKHPIDANLFSMAMSGTWRKQPVNEHDEVAPQQQSLKRKHCEVIFDDELEVLLQSKRNKKQWYN